MTSVAGFACRGSQGGRISMVSCDMDGCRAGFVAQTDEQVRSAVEVGWRRDMVDTAKHWCPAHSGAGPVPAPG